MVLGMIPVRIAMGLYAKITGRAQEEEEENEEEDREEDGERRVSRRERMMRGCTGSALTVVAVLGCDIGHATVVATHVLRPSSPHQARARPVMRALMLVLAVAVHSVTTLSTTVGFVLLGSNPRLSFPVAPIFIMMLQSAFMGVILCSVFTALLDGLLFAHCDDLERTGGLHATEPVWSLLDASEVYNTLAPMSNTHYYITLSLLFSLRISMLLPKVLWPLHEILPIAPAWLLSPNLS